MASEQKPLRIAYSGSLDAKKQSAKKGFWPSVLQWFWTYKHDTVDPSTRSAYYLILAVKELKKTQQITGTDLQIQFWGSINPLNGALVESEGVKEFFTISDYLPKPESIQKLSEADMLFLPLEKSNVQGQGTLFIPGKLFEYLNTRKPILALCEDSDCKDILKKSGLGIIVEPDNIQAIAEILLHYIKDRDALSKIIPNSDYIEGYSFRNKTSELADVFNSLLSKT